MDSSIASTLTVARPAQPWRESENTPSKTQLLTFLRTTSNPLATSSASRLTSINIFSIHHPGKIRIGHRSPVTQRGLQTYLSCTLQPPTCNLYLVSVPNPLPKFRRTLLAHMNFLFD